MMREVYICHNNKVLFSRSTLSVMERNKSCFSSSELGHFELGKLFKVSMTHSHILSAFKNGNRYVFFIDIKCKLYHLPLDE